jgi:hypothetical protein
VNVNTVVSDQIGMSTGYDNKVPEIYFLKKCFDFCQSGEFCPELVAEGLPGGSVPDGWDVQEAGCIEWIVGDRQWSYIFTGEQIVEFVVARDPNGVVDLTDAYLEVDGVSTVKCIPIDREVAEQWAGAYCDETLDIELGMKPHETIAGVSSIPAGYNANYDQIYACLLTVTDDMSGDLDITVSVYDESDEMGTTDPQTWTFNPAIGIQITSDPIMFPQAAAGATVYSEHDLVIENPVDGKVAVAIWLGGTDLYSPSMAARCPWSNVLDVDKQMDFRCKLNDGIYFDQIWHDVKNKDLTDVLGCWMPVGTDGTCFGLNPIFNHDRPAMPLPLWNILLPGDKASCEFKLTYPVPCVGEFDTGSLYILLRAV